MWVSERSPAARPYRVTGTARARVVDFVQGVTSPSLTFRVRHPSPDNVYKSNIVTRQRAAHTMPFC